MKAKVAIPSKQQEKEALQWAEAFFRNNAHQLSRDASKCLRQEAAYDSLKFWHDERQGDDLVALMVKGTEFAPALRKFALELTKRGEPLPKPLRGFVVEGKRRNRRHGPRGTDLQLRDTTIAFAINHIVGKWKFLASRNKASKDHACAVSIAQEGLKAGANIHLEEDAIDKIWGRYKKFLNPTSSEKKAANK